MGESNNWRNVWEETSKEDLPDFELDRGVSPREQEIEALSVLDHVNFIDPRQGEVVLDAGCGTGVNILRLHARVRSMVGIDYASGSLRRCLRKIHAGGIKNAQVCLASLTAVPLPNHSVNKILCFSVLQYLDDEEVRRALNEFVRILTPGGMIVLHVKNSSSLYWSTLSLAKKTKTALGWTTQSYYVRSFEWYVKELASVNCRVVASQSFNLMTLDRMPTRLVNFLQAFELLHQKKLSQIPFLARLGADLKIKAVVD